MKKITTLVLSLLVNAGAAAVAFGQEADTNEAAAAPTEQPAAAPAKHHRRSPAPKPARTYDQHNHFSESTPPDEYRLPPSGQVLVPREGQSVLNGPNHEGVPPPNSDPVRLTPDQ